MNVYTVILSGRSIGTVSIANTDEGSVHTRKNRSFAGCPVLTVLSNNPAQDDIREWDVLRDCLEL